RRVPRARAVEVRREGSAEDEPWEMFSSMQRAALATGAPQSRVAALCDSRGAYAGWQFRWPAYLPARDVGQPSPSPPGRPAQAPIPAMAPLALPDAAEEPTLGGSPTLAPRGSPALAPGQSPGLRPQECAPQFRQCPGCSFAVTWHHSHCCNACARGQGHGPRRAPRSCSLAPRDCGRSASSTPSPWRSATKARPSGRGSPA
ncbi:unnamed protein product, partial [Prorocentrum cordatum]